MTKKELNVNELYQEVQKLDGYIFPVALPVLGVTIGIGFCIGLIRRFV